MTHVQLARPAAAPLPAGESRRVSSEVRRARRVSPAQLWHFAAEYLLFLPAGALLAMAWVHVWPESYFRTVVLLRVPVAELGLALFFGLMTKEVVEAAAPGGALHTWRRAALPLCASTAAAAVPVVLYLQLVTVFDEPLLARGWPAVIVTDVAFGYLVARVVFGRHGAVPFFVLVGLGTNAIGLAAVAVATADVVQPALAAPLLALAVALAATLRAAQIHSFWPYILLAGGAAWCGLYFGGLPAALALVPVVPFIPRGRRDPGLFVDAPPGARDALSRFEGWCRHPAQVALLLFGLVGGGVPLAALDAGAWSLPLAVLAGKPAGLLLGVGLGVGLGLRLPQHIGWRQLLVLGCIASIGFTGTLYFAAVVVGPGPMLSSLRLGALLTVAGGACALAAARILRVGRFA